MHPAWPARPYPSRWPALAIRHDQRRRTVTARPTLQHLVLVLVVVRPRPVVWLLSWLLPADTLIRSSGRIGCVEADTDISRHLVARSSASRLARLLYLSAVPEFPRRPQWLAGTRAAGVAPASYCLRVTLADVTRAGVLAAIKEFDRLGREAFLKSTGFGRSRAYYLDYEGRLYDSKAIVGYAHGVSTGTPWGPKDLRGRDKTVAQRLESLGFTVAFLPNPDWTRDEIILACELVESNGWHPLDANDVRVKALSELLQSPVIHPGRRNPDFRNPAGVALKTYNIVSDSSHGNRLDKLVREEFRANPVEMRALAARIRELLREGIDGEFNNGANDPDVDEMSAREGGIVLRAHLRRERDPKLRRRKLAHAKRRGVPIACEVCGFDFERIYGDRGRDYIECHHRTPLHVTGETETRLSDLALICSNCHRMVHRTNPWLTVEALKELVTSRAAQAKHRLPHEP